MAALALSQSAAPSRPVHDAPRRLRAARAAACSCDHIAEEGVQRAPAGLLAQPSAQPCTHSQALLGCLAACSAHAHPARLCAVRRTVRRLRDHPVVRIALEIVRTAISAPAATVTPCTCPRSHQERPVHSLAATSTKHLETARNRLLFCSSKPSLPGSALHRHWRYAGLAGRAPQEAVAALQAQAAHPASPCH